MPYCFVHWRTSETTLILHLNANGRFREAAVRHVLEFEPLHWADRDVGGRPTFRAGSCRSRRSSRYIHSRRSGRSPRGPFRTRPRPIMPFRAKRDYTVWAVGTCPNVVRITATGGRIGNRYGSCLSPPFERAAPRDGSGGSRMARRGRSRLSRPCAGSRPLVRRARGYGLGPAHADCRRRNTLSYRGLQQCVARRTSRLSIPRHCHRPRRVRNHLEEKT